ncbi:hypothetical protein H6758_04485 [Candidatus Nomurabacteria bacterium]|nr:hypothetical protein [Candidatus Nomurabacteria bacterium]
MLPRLRVQKIQRTALKVAIFGFAVLFVFSFFDVSAVFAQQPDVFGTGYGAQTGLGQTDIRETIARIIRVFLGLLGIIAFVLVIYAGYEIMTAGGEEDKVNRGKQILKNAVIGLAIIMSAFAIVSFIISRLSEATGSGRGNGGQAGEVVFQSFGGSGGLGRIIRDHYPFRDARNISRNTRIVVTFNEPIDPASVIEDHNGNGILGDCLEVENLSWEQHCDRVKPEAVIVTKFDPDIEDEAAQNIQIEAAALALYEGQEQKVYTFVFKPLEYLGSDQKEMQHTVRLTNEIIKFDDSRPAFDNFRTNYYEWKFITSTELDLIGPNVRSTYPRAPRQVGEELRYHVIPRNSIVQINFNEPMDPTTVQGVLDQANNFTNVIFKRTNGDVMGEVEGEWHVTNGYRTIEFTSSEACGQNSCGEAMYCLPTGCASGDSECREDYEILIRTARAPEGKFEAFPFTGVTDISGNALDGNADEVYDGKPDAGDLSQIGEGEDAPDNYDYTFKVKNQIDRTSPYVRQVNPALDAEDVEERQEMSFTFSKIMWLSTLNRARIVEYGSQDQQAAINAMDEFWYAPFAEQVPFNPGEENPEEFVSKVEMRHRVFGPNALELFYFPIVPSNVKGINQNCVYPGRGPYSQGMGESPTCDYQVDDAGRVVVDENCALVKTLAVEDTACVDTQTPTNFHAGNPDTDTILYANVDACLDSLKAKSDGLFEAQAEAEQAVQPDVE